MRGSVSSRLPIFHGWYVVGACIVTSMVIVGARNSIGVFVIPMSEDFGWNRGTVSLAASLSFLLSGLMQPLLGGLYDRIGGRRVILWSLITLGLATLALSLTFHILFLMIVFGIVSGTAYSGASPSNTGALLSNWFRRRRATALGLNAAGLALGGLTLIPLAIYIIQVANWRITWAALGSIVLLVAVPLVYLLIQDAPEKLGLMPDGDSQPPEEDLSQASIGQPGPLETAHWVESFRSWPVWQMSTALSIDGVTTSVLLVHFVPYANDRGASPSTAALLFGLMMMMSFVGSTTTGMVSDRMERRSALTLIYGLRGCGFLALLLLPGNLGLWVSAAAIGFSWNAAASLTSSLIADIYGLRLLGMISGMAYLFRQVAGASGVLLTGYLYDASGAYTIPFAMIGALLLPAALAAFMVKERKYSARYQDRPVAAPLAALRSGI